MASTSLLKPTDLFLSSSLLKPTALFPSNTPFLSLPSKPISLPFSLKKKLLTTHHQTLIPLVAQTSDWAQQEPENTVTVEVEELGVGDGVSAELEGEGQEAEEGGDFVGEEGYPEPPEDAKLFVGNLPYDVDSQQLAELFNQAGVVELAEVIYNRETDQSRGFGFICMSTVEEAEKAIEMFNRHDYNGRLLTVNKAAPRGARPERPAREFEPSFRIYVGNLPWQVDDARLEQVFSEHGKVVSAHVVSDRETGRSRGFGFVTMASQDEQQDAISALDGQTLDGRAIRVNVAEERPRRGSF